MKSDRKTYLYVKTTLYVLFFPLLSFSNSLDAFFNTNPATVNGTVTICRTQSVTYTDASSSTNTNTAYNWQFQGGNITSATTVGPHTITYTNAGTYTTTLTLDNTSSYSITVIVLNNLPSTPSIQLIDGNFWSAITYNGTNYFTYCSNDANISGGLFSFTTNSTRTNSNSQHILDWGDGTSDTFTGSNLSDTFHFYANAGNYTLTYTVLLDNACSSTRIYNLYVGAIPTATISAVGIPTLCNPGSVTYDLLIGAQNTPGTTYTFQVNDGTPPVTFNHPPPATITHQFLDSSCGNNSNINNTVYPNSYQASITVNNPCGNSTNAVGPINIQSAPVANFTRTPSNNIVCEGTTVAFSDSTEGGYNIGGPPTYTCTQTYRKYWTISGPGGIIATSSGGLLVANPYITCTNNFGFNNNQPNNPGAWLPIASSVLNITFLLPGDYTINFYSGSNLCGISSTTQTICVTPRVTADFTFTNSNNCAPTTITSTNNSSTPGCNNTISYTWNVIPSNPDNCPSYDANGWTFSNGNASDATPEITITTPGIYEISLTAALDIPTAGALCTANTKTETITIAGKPITSLTAETICEGNSITLNPTVFNCYATNPVSYFWDFGTNPPTTISSVNDAAPSLTFETAGTYNYSLTISNECGSNTYNSSITVVPKVNLTANGTAATCVNTVIQLTGNISGGTTSGTWSASVAGGTFTPNENDLNPTYTPPLDFIGTITFTLTSDTPIAPCTVVSESFSTVFNNEATSNAGTYDPLCENTTIQLNGIIGGAAANGTWSDSVGGVFSNTNDSNSSYTPPLGYIGDIVLTLTTNDPPGPCDAVSNSTTLTVLPTPVVNPINDIINCDNTTNTSINFSGNNANVFDWTNSNTSIGLPASGSGNINFTTTNTTNSAITSTITVTPINNVSTSFCDGNPVTFSITVNPKAQVNPINNQTICNGDLTSLIEFSTANLDGNTTYEWTNDTPSIGLASNGIGNISTFITTNPTNNPIVATITVTPTYTNNGISCAGESRTFTITVIPTIQVNPISNITYCNNDTITPISFTSTITGGVMTYEWTNDNPSIGLNATGTGNINFIPTNNTTTPIIATINVTPIFTLNGTSCSGNSESFTITVNPSAQVNTTSDQTICNNSNTNPIVFTTTNTLGTTVFNWTNNNTSIGLNATGSGDISSFIAINNTLSPITATITVTPTYTYNGISCIGNSEQINITVNPSAQVNPVSDITICNNDTTTPIQFTTSNTNGSTIYNWTNSNPAIGIPSNGTGDIPSFIANNLSNTPITALITVTPTFTNNGTTCSGNAITFTITVNPNGQIDGIGNQFVCSGNQVNEIVFTTNIVGNTTFSWTNDTPSIGLAANGTGNINAFIASNPTLNPINATITVTPEFNFNGVTCIGNPIQFTITVNQSPNVIFSENNQIICSGENTTEVLLSSGTPNVIYNWSSNTPAGILGISPSGTNTIPVQNLINTTNEPITITYQAYAVTNDAASCQGNLFDYNITVLPKPNIPDEDLFLCSEQNFIYTPTNGNPNSSTIVPLATNYSWVVTPNAFITGASNGTGNTISQTLTNISATPQTITYTVTPEANGCIGNNFTLNFTVLPKPDVLFNIPNQFLCNNSNSLEVVLNSTISGSYTYYWNATIPSEISGATSSGTGNIPSQIFTNTSNSPQTITYEVYAVFENLGSSCTGPISTYEITVYPAITINSILSDYNGFNISGFGGNNGFIHLNIEGGSESFNINWTGPNGFNASNQNIDNLIAGNYSVTINDGICPPSILNFTLTQPDELLITNNTLAFQDASCYGTGSGTLGVIISQESVPPYNLEIFSNGTSVQTITNTFSTSPIFSGLFAGIYNIQITDANGNTKTITNLIITEPTEMIATATATQISCFGSNDASITLSIIGGTPPYNVNWNNFATGTQLNNLGAGTYTAIITDAKGCEKIVQTTIDNLPVFMLQPVVNQITCYGETDGSIDLGLIGGLAPVTVTWNDGSTAGLVRNNLTEGIYIAIVTDGMGCTIQRTFSIVAPQVLILDGIVQNALDCTTSNSGGINLIPSGGSPPYSFNWSNGATTEDLTNVTNGNYSVIVTDSRGCSEVAQYTIYRPEPLQISLNQSRNVDCSVGEIINNFEAIVSGGVQPYQIIWSNGIVSGVNNEFMTTDQNGLITATVIDGNNCSNSANFTISNPEIGNAYFTQNSFSQTTFGYYSIEDPVQFNNLTTGDFIGISWNFGDGVFSTDENPEHSYLAEGTYNVTLTITYDLGCSSTYSNTITITKGYKLIIPNGFTANNDNINETFGPAFEGLKSLQLNIYDSWGNLIYFEEGDNLAGWNGMINNIPAENGNYYYKLVANTFFGKKIEQSGVFVLLK
jgi:gliding motility-associated-like protein